MTKHRLHQIQLAQNGCEETQKFLDAIGIDWDNGEPINNGLTDTQADFLSPKQFARPKEKRLLSLIHISEPTRRTERSRMPSSA